MGIILELLVGIFLEGLLGLIGEVVVELGFSTVADRFSGRAWKRIFTVFAYIVAGIILGAVSLMVVSKQPFADWRLATIYFVLSPVVGGFLLCLMNWMLHRDLYQLRVFEPAKFLYGAIFILAFSITRNIVG